MGFFLGDSKEQIYWDNVMEAYLPKSKLAIQEFKNLKPFKQGEERLWQQEIDQIELFVHLMKKNKNLKNELGLLFSEFHDISLILEKIEHRNFKDVDPLTDGYQIKQFLWLSYSLSGKILSFSLEKDFRQYIWYRTAEEPWEDWLKVFHPSDSNFYPQFALQDIDNKQLKKMRANKRILLKEKRKFERNLEEQLKATYGLAFNQKQYMFVPIRFNKLEQIQEDTRLRLVSQQHEGFFFKLAINEEIGLVEKELNELEKLIRDSEETRFQQIFEGLKDDIPKWVEAHHSWAKLEVLFKKAEMALDHHATKPFLENNAKETVIKKGIHPYISEQWGTKGMEPLSLSIKNGVTVIYGANMSGKTIALRLVGLLQALAQFGFYVPAEYYHFSFVSHLSLMTGDYQNITDELSSFGAEIKRLSNDLSHVDDRILLLLDETGKGTNPLEGEALTISIINFLKYKEGVQCLLVTHFPNAIHVEDIELYEASYHHLCKAENGMMVYKAIEVAEALGLPREIISEAKAFLINKT